MLKRTFVIFIVLVSIFIRNVYAIGDNIKDVQTPYYLVYERNTKQVILQKNGDVKVPNASTTKILTAIVLLENGNLEDIVEVGKNAQNVVGWQLDLKAGDKISLNDLLHAILMYSANDAAVAIAEHISGSVEEFSKLLNTKAKEIGAVNTNFESPHGLDSTNHYSTAYDLAIILDYALNFEEIQEILKLKEYNIYVNNQKRTITNTNKLLDCGIYGKTGYTSKAMYCLLSTKKDKELDMIGVVLGSSTSNIRFKDTEKLYLYCTGNYTILNISDLLKEDIIIPVKKGDKDYINLKIADNNSIVVKKDDIDNIQVNYDIPDFVVAPVEENTAIGRAIIRNNEKILENVELVNIEICEKVDIKSYFLYILKRYANLLEIE